MRGAAGNSTIEVALNSTSSEAAGEWKVVLPRGGRNRFRSPPSTHPVAGTKTTGDTAVSTAELSTAEVSRRLKAEGWPGGIQFSLRQTAGNRQLAGTGDRELATGKKKR